MSTKGITGAGAVLSVATPGTNETYVTVGQLTDFDFSGISWDFSEITNLSSPVQGAGVVKERMPTVIDPGKTSLGGVYYTPDVGQALLFNAFQTGGVLDFKIVLPKQSGQTTTGDTYKWSGWVAEMPAPTGVSVSKHITFKVSVQNSTFPAFTAGS